jgi:hypothetical protein
MHNFIYKGTTYKNCGPTNAQSSALSEDQAFGAELRNAYSTDFSEAQGLFNELHSNLDSIVAAGPSQQGMSPEELAAENGQAINAASASNKSIQAAIGERGTMDNAAPGVESGVESAVRAKGMSDVENNLSNQEAKITERNYDIGRQNYENAVKGEMDLSGATMNPVTEAANSANTAGKNTSEQANENAAASKSWMGMLGGLADSAVGGGPIGKMISRWGGGGGSNNDGGGSNNDGDGSNSDGDNAV